MGSLGVVREEDRACQEPAAGAGDVAQASPGPSVREALGSISSTKNQRKAPATALEASGPRKPGQALDMDLPEQAGLDLMMGVPPGKGSQGWTQGAPGAVGLAGGTEGWEGLERAEPAVGAGTQLSCSPIYNK